jgi:predicted S18 family serine protease
MSTNTTGDSRIGGPEGLDQTGRKDNHAQNPNPGGNYFSSNNTKPQPPMHQQHLNQQLQQQQTNENEQPPSSASQASSQFENINDFLNESYHDMGLYLKKYAEKYSYSEQSEIELIQAIDQFYQFVQEYKEQLEQRLIKKREKLIKFSNFAVNSKGTVIATTAVDSKDAMGGVLSNRNPNVTK